MFFYTSYKGYLERDGTSQDLHLLLCLFFHLVQLKMLQFILVLFLLYYFHKPFLFVFLSTLCTSYKGYNSIILTANTSDDRHEFYILIIATDQNLLSRLFFT